MCGKPVERELEAVGLVTFLCRTHRVVLRMLATEDHDGDFTKVPCRHHASDANGRPQPGKCRFRRVNVWGWEEMP